MKKNAFLLLLCTAFTASANSFPNNSFEYDVEPLWNRMPDEEVMRSKKEVFSYSSDCVSGKRSLHLKGQKLEVAYESGARFQKGRGFFSLMMKALRPVRVKVQCVYYLETDKSSVIEKSFKVTEKWQNFLVPTDYPFGRFRRSGMTIGPTKVIIDPGKNEILVDDCFLSEGKRPPKKIPAGPATGVPEKEMTLPPYIPLPAADSFGNGECTASTWEFRLFPGKGGAESNVPLSGVMLFPKSKVYFNSGTFALYDGAKKLPARFYPVSAWPGDRSLAALRVDFTADTASKVKALKLRFTPGAKKNIASLSLAASGVKADPDASELWEQNGTLGKAVLAGRDYTGRKYTFKKTFSTFENGTLLRRGKMVSADGKSMGAVDIRLKGFGSRSGVELDIALSNTSKKFILIKELFWQSEAPAGLPHGCRTIWGDHLKKRFTEKQIINGRTTVKTYQGTLEELPEFTLSSPGGVSLHVFNGAQTFPNELEMTPGAVKGALWPASAKVLSLAPGMTLRKKFLVSPAPLFKTPDTPAMVMAAAKHFADSKVMISMCASNPKRQPFFEKRLKEGLGRLSFAELHSRFCYGQFNYGDHYGDGGWGNLESFEDYVLYHRAMRSEDPALFRLAQTASRHYADIDTDIRNGLPHTHSANHIIGGNGFGHAWIPGVMSAWLLTGDPAIYQTARRQLDACIKLPLDSGEIQQGRNFGFFLLTLAEGYAIFNDPAAVKRYMAQLNYQIDRFEKNAPTAEEKRLQRTSVPRQNSLFYVTTSGLVPFHCWYGLTAFLKMYHLTGDPLIRKVLEKEFANIMNLEMTFRPQIETHWPGLPAEQLMPTIATDYLFGRGAFFYPVLAMYAEMTGNKKYLELAVDTLYSGLLASRSKGNIQDVFMAAPLGALPENFDEAKQLEKIRRLLWAGAAPKLLNGDFSHSLLYSDLVIPKKGIGTPRYPEWALKKPYPRWWHLVEGKQIISSMFMTFRGYYYTLDTREYGKAAPSLRLDMSTRRYFSGSDLTSARFQMLPGEWEFSVSLKKGSDTSIKRIGMRIIAFGKYTSRVSVGITSDGKIIKDEKSDPRFGLHAVSWSETGKPNWRRLTFKFRLAEKALGSFFMDYGMLPRAKEAHIHLDDVEIRRSGK